MGTWRTVLPFTLAATDESLTAHGGVALFGEYLRAMSIHGLIDHELPGPGSAVGYDPSAHRYEDQERIAEKAKKAKRKCQGLTQGGGALRCSGSPELHGEKRFRLSFSCAGRDAS